ncbi:hypothetical protein MANY_29790 [Mycolicibacterium anyangense]|uniref:Uncharacterized protein n=1 Tax=Mycolicibacterium anyangense TaxID=1431246 RepID=A0A6N4WC62_9MYCO|nr:hypothetical protein MANY_29790 [Mycolicibacterium anyangense]
MSVIGAETVSHFAAAGLFSSEQPAIDIASAAAITAATGATTLRNLNPFEIRHSLPVAPAGSAKLC